MSFFDEADEPQPTPQAQARRPRSAPRPRQQRSGRPPGGSGRPPGGQHQQEVQTRRLIAAAVIVVIVIALALLIKSCDSSATTSALKNYNASVFSLISASDANGGQVFQRLKAGNLSNINLAPQVQAADSQLRTAQRLHAPSQMSSAQNELVNVMQLRARAIGTIAAKAPQAANKNTSKDALANISVGTSELFASDVLYKDFVATDIAKALNANNIPVGSAAGQQQINPGQIVPDLGWLQQRWIATTIGAQETTAQANINNSQPNLGHGHQLNYVTVDGITLNPTGTTTVPAANARTWTLNLSNSGQTNENQVVCLLRIHGIESGTATIPQTTPGEVTSCTVTLPSAPLKGSYSVTATIEKVPFENDLQNNTHTYSVTFN